MVDTVTSLGSIYCLITAIHYAILFWWYMYANRKYYSSDEHLGHPPPDETQGPRTDR